MQGQPLTRESFEWMRHYCATVDRHEQVAKPIQLYARFRGKLSGAIEPAGRSSVNVWVAYNTSIRFRLRTQLPGDSMSDIPSVCPKCQGKMVRGFLADFNYGAVGVGTWVEGPPQKSFWTGTKIEPRKKLYVATFRCKSCGFLESYARKEFAPK